MQTSQAPTTSIELRQPKAPTSADETNVEGVSVDKSQTAQKVSTATSATNQASLPTANKNRRPRCSHSDCKKRLGLVPIECRCGMKLCPEHRLPKDHSCAFDYKSNTRKLLQQESVTASPVKLSQI